MKCTICNDGENYSSVELIVHNNIKHKASSNSSGGSSNPSVFSGPRSVAGGVVDEVVNRIPFVGGNTVTGIMNPKVPNNNPTVPASDSSWGLASGLGEEKKQNTGSGNWIDEAQENKAQEEEQNRRETIVRHFINAANSIGLTDGAIAYVTSNIMKYGTDKSVDELINGITTAENAQKNFKPGYGPNPGPIPVVVTGTGTGSGTGSGSGGSGSGNGNSSQEPAPTNTASSAENAEYVKNIYKDYLGRQPSDQEVAQGIEKLSGYYSKSQVLNELVNSAEAKVRQDGMMASTNGTDGYNGRFDDVINKVLKDYTGNSPSEADIKIHGTALMGGMSLDSLRNYLQNSPAVQTHLTNNPVSTEELNKQNELFRFATAGSVSSDADYVKSMYENYLGRPATDQEVAQGVAQLESTSTRSQLLNSLVNTDEAKTFQGSMSVAGDKYKDVVTRMWKDYVGTEPDESALRIHGSALANGMTLDEFRGYLQNAPAVQNHIANNPVTSDELSAQNGLLPVVTQLGTGGSNSNTGNGATQTGPQTPSEQAGSGLGRPSTGQNTGGSSTPGTYTRNDSDSGFKYPWSAAKSVGAVDVPDTIDKAINFFNAVEGKNYKYDKIKGTITSADGKFVNRDDIQSLNNIIVKYHKTGFNSSDFVKNTPVLSNTAGSVVPNSTLDGLSGSAVSIGGNSQLSEVGGSTGLSGVPPVNRTTPEGFPTTL